MINFSKFILIFFLAGSTLVAPIFGRAQESKPLPRILRVDFVKEHGTKVLDFSRRAVDGIEGDADYKLPNAKFGVTYYRVVYRLDDTFGHPSHASGMVILPKSEEFRGVISFQHGTVLNRNEVPSQSHQDSSVIAMALAFGSQGYIVALPDYLGLGESPGFHPFLHAASEASAARGLLEATRELVQSRTTAWNPNLFIAGYSQGGHATLALQRSLEESALEGFNLVASAPMSGPYDLSGATYEGFKANPSAPRILFTAYFVAALNEVSGGVYSGDEFFQPGKRRFVRDFFSGLSKDIPENPAELFDKGAAMKALLEPKHQVWTILASNNVYDFKPLAPVRFFHSSGDQVIPFSNASVASKRMNDLGGVTEIQDLGSANNHVQDFGAAIVGCLKWFEEIRVKLQK